MANKNLTKLLASAQGGGKARCLDPATAKKIDADLREIVKFEQDYKPIPTQQAIADYFHSEYGLDVTRWTVRTWLGRARRGLSIR